MTYANLNNLVSTSGDYWTYAGNQLQLYLQRGAGGVDGTHWTTNDLWGVNLVLKQTLDAAHVGVTLKSCTISGPNIKDYPPRLSGGSTADGAFSVGWEALAGQAYQLQTATNLSSGSWDNLGGAFIAARSPVAVTNAIGTDPARFYRVKAVGN